MARLAVVQPGVRNLAISEAAAPFALYYAPDPSSQIACTIGGNVAENSGGVHCLKYGLTVHNVLRVRGLTMAGEVVEFGNHGLDAPGYDLLALLHGSEGLLAVITEVTVKLSPKPQTAQVIMASFDDVAAAGAAVAAIIAAGIIPAGLEMMDQPAVAAVEPFVQAGYDLNAAAMLLCESDGTAAEVAEEIAAMRARAGALRRQRHSRVLLGEPSGCASGPDARPPFPPWGASRPTTTAWTAPFRASAWPKCSRPSPAWSSKYGLRCANVFHAGDGNLHPLIMYDANLPGELQRTEAFGAEILELSVQLGGTITGEHGVGLEKINSMCVQFNADELTVLHRVKARVRPPGPAQPRQGRAHAAPLRRVRPHARARRRS